MAGGGFVQSKTSGMAIASLVLGLLWIYGVGPLTGMLLAAEAFVHRRGLHAVHCAKLHHHTSARCIFHCRFGVQQP